VETLLGESKFPRSTPPKLILMKRVEGRDDNSITGSRARGYQERNDKEILAIGHGIKGPPSTLGFGLWAITT